VTKQSTVQRITVKGTRGKRAPRPPTVTLYIVMGETTTRNGQLREFPVEVFANKDVAEFRANGAMMFADSTTDRFYVRTISMIPDENIETYLRRLNPSG
jgi:hypothetical protein